MKALLAFLLVPASFAVYFVLSTGFGIYQRYPVAHYLVALVGVALLLWLVVQSFSWWRLTLNLGAWALLGMFVWWSLGYSSYGPPEGGGPDGKSVVDGAEPVTLIGTDGNVVSLGPLLAGSPSTLLVFYRGYW